MKLQDLKDMDKDDLLAMLGLQTKASDSEKLLGTLGTFAVGVLVGAGVALLLAPKDGRALREDIRSRVQRGKDVLDGGANSGTGEPGTTHRA